MSTSVFISRAPEEVSNLIGLLQEQQIEVIAKSLIQTEEITFPRELPLTDWIFFSSARSVQYFFLQQPHIMHQKFGCIGEKTATELRKHATPSYVGENIDTMMTAREFADFIGTDTVLFPGAEDSLRTIQSALPKEQCRELTCYRTIAQPVAIPVADVLVFSSPSNVHSFFQNNTHHLGQHYVAFGPSTLKALESYGIGNTRLPETLSDESILKAIKQCVMS
ncbi:MAG: uroporphyrinogen-III synthase [Flavobacteriales bacterium]|nr:uroporphyrinogen-III synthase [Flavobacteriales bacterium]